MREWLRFKRRRIGVWLCRHGHHKWVRVVSIDYAHSESHVGMMLMAKVCVRPTCRFLIAERYDIVGKSVINMK